MLIKPFFVAIGRSYLHDLSTTLLKRLNYYEVKLHVKSASFSTDNIFLFFYHISNDKNFIPKYLDNALTIPFNFTNIEATIGGKSCCDRFWKNSSHVEILLQA